MHSKNIVSRVSSTASSPCPHKDHAYTATTHACERAHVCARTCTHSHTGWWRGRKSGGNGEQKEGGGREKKGGGGGGGGESNAERYPRQTLPSVNFPNPTLSRHTDSSSPSRPQLPPSPPYNTPTPPFQHLAHPTLLDLHTYVLSLSIIGKLPKSEFSLIGSLWFSGLASHEL